MQLEATALAGAHTSAPDSGLIWDDASAIPRWYALYVVPRHEKAVAERLIALDVEHYLPLYSASRVWRTRHARVTLPLFPGYVFVRMRASDKGRVLSLMGVIRLVTFNGIAAVVSDDEMIKLKGLISMHGAKPYPYLTAGRRVYISSGPFSGMHGQVLRRKGAMRLILSVDFINSAIVVELDAGNAQLLI